jgi:hypothetical protein
MTSTASLRTEIVRCSWERFHALPALRRVPALVLTLVLGLAMHQAAAGILATAAALSVGLAATRQVGGSRWLAMLLTALVMAVSAVVGTWSATVHALALGMTLLWGFGCGMLAVLDDDAGWIAVQATIALLVASTFPSHGYHALERGAAILIGGLLQAVLLMILWRLAGIGRFGAEEASLPRPSLPGAYLAFWKRVGDSWTWSSQAIHFALQVAITLALAIEIDHQLHLKNGYWLPMTTLVVLKPDFSRTYHGGVERVIGTLAGVVIASGVASLCHPQALALVVLVGACAFLTYALAQVNPVLMALAMTSVVVYLIEVSGISPADVIWHRLENTALGCAVALVSVSCLPNRSSVRPVSSP